MVYNIKGLCEVQVLPRNNTYLKDWQVSETKLNTAFSVEIQTDFDRLGYIVKIKWAFSQLRNLREWG